MSESQKKRFSNPEERRKQSEIIKKSWDNPELRKKQSEVHKGKPSHRKGKKHSLESRLKMSESHKEQMANSEVRKKMSEVTKNLWNDFEFRKKQIESRKGKNYSQRTEFKKGLVPWNKGIKFPEESERSEWQIKVSKLSKERVLKMYQSGKFPKQTNTKPERQIKEELLKRGYKEGVDFIHQYKFMNEFMCDFCFPKQKAIVEVFGDYWHTHPIKYPIPKNKMQKNVINIDNKKEAYITKIDNNSWTYLVLWESDIKKNVSECVDKIEKVLIEKKKF
jgi:G:T-mismatch repair DNA endonuclease (very short patch repair protein)